MGWPVTWYVTNNGTFSKDDDARLTIGRMTKEADDQSRWHGVTLDGRKFVGRTRRYVSNQMIAHHQRDSQWKYRRKNHWKEVDSE